MVMVICWSSVPLFLKYFTPYLDAWTTNGIRYPVATIFLLPLLGWSIYQGKIPRQVWRQALLPTGFNLASQIVWAWAPYFIDPARLSFTVRLSVVWSVLGAFILFREERRLGRSFQFWCGLILSLLGFLLIIFGGKFRLIGTRRIGVIMALVCSLFTSGYGLSVRHILKQIDARTAFSIIACYTSIGTIILMLIFGNYQAVVNLPLRLFVLVPLSALIGIAMSHILFYHAVKQIGITLASSLNLLAAFLTALGSGFIFNESLTALQWNAGALLIFGAILLILVQEKIHQIQDP